MTDELDPPEAELWERSLAGDAGAFGCLFDRHRDKVFRQAMRLGDSQDDAEDIAAAAFLELWRRRRDVRLVGGSVLPWLLVTAANLARNATRARRRYRAFLADLPRAEPARDAETLAMAQRAVSLQPALREALLSLPEADLHLLSLVAFEDLPLADAAAALDITPSAAKTRLHRLRVRLRPLLAGFDTTSTAPGGQR